MTHGKRAAAAAALLALGACGAEDPAESRAAVTAADGQMLYAEFCTACHGAGAQGDGPLAPGVTPPPPDLTGIAARNGGQFDYAAVMSTIDGYKAADRSMPRFGDLLAEGGFIPFDAGDGTLTPTPIPLVALARYLETVQRP